MTAPTRSNRPKRSLHVPNVGHKAPIPLGARVGNLICSSGIIGKDPANGALPADAAAVYSDRSGVYVGVPKVC